MGEVNYWKGRIVVFEGDVAHISFLASISSAVDVRSNAGLAPRPFSLTIGFITWMIPCGFSQLSLISSLKEIMSTDGY